MATYAELRALFNDSELRNKVTTAVVIAANNLISGGTPTAADRAYAAQVFASPEGEARKVLMSVLAENAGLTVTQIQNASDAAIQTNVDAVIPQLRDAFAGA